MVFTVKARGRQGTNSLDLTIPSKTVKDEKVSIGDIFELNVTKQNNELTLEYKRVYKKK
jgi:antitoxin component of MazEF toxin-antitoxin module